MNAAEELPQFVRDIIANPPSAGDGVNNWLFRAARVLHPCRSSDQIAAYLRAATYNCGRPVTEKEIARAVERSRPHARQPGQLRPPAQSTFSAELRKIPLNKPLREQITEDGLGLYDLWEASPVVLEESGPSEPDYFIDVLFPGNPWLCCGKSKSRFFTRHRETWRGHWHEMALMVPSPMLTQKALNTDGKMSEHTLAGTGERRFLVIEFDTGAADEHAALLWHLQAQAPLAAVVGSGGKSLHGWFFCLGQPEPRLEKFMRYACSLGADPATWLRSQFVRIPGGTRETGEPQTCYFFNPEAAKEVHGSAPAN